MSKSHRGDRGRGHGSNPTGLSNALAEALKAAGVGKPAAKDENDQVPKQTSARTREPEKKKPKKVDAELFREAVHDVKPLEAESSIILSPERYPAKPREQNRMSRGGVRFLRKRVTKPKQKGVSPGKRIGSLQGRKPRAVSQRGAKVTISGDGFLEWGKPKKKLRSTEKVQRTLDLKLTGNISINQEALKDDQEHFCSRSSLAHLSWLKPDEAGDEIDLVIGLDFGTAYCKAVVQEPGSGVAWAIPLAESASNPYILSSKVWQDGDVFNLQGEGEIADNLKVPLLTRNMPTRHAASVIAFLALVICHIKGWVSAHKADELAGTLPLWSVHMGLPARNLQDKKMVDTFKKLLWAALILAEQPRNHVSLREAEQSLAIVQRAAIAGNKKVSAADGGEIYAEQVGIFPEIAAQIYGYLKSDFWDRAQTTFILVDVGGGTIDGSIFRVKETASGETQFAFLASAVETLGVYVLHRHRLEWHLRQLHGKEYGKHLANEFQRMLSDNVMPAEIPDDIEEYLIGAEYPDETCDEMFYRRFGNLLWDEVVMGARDYIGPGTREWANLPFLLCGGGRSIGLYNRFIKFVNSPNSSTSLHLREIPMKKPANLDGTGIGEEEYQRLSVAYGLSFLDIGEVITPDMFPRPQPRATRPDFSDAYIGKEQT